ncbi:type I-E CRISPR-associated protein Cas6/Cse3/CasE [Endozoicomonas sp. SESOKO1]|uniref:type I-E CRISPR-associated protein Cas6/Cse3/CasE n=1 Tax=Endozoicomonas sp. SESOKO1 TaxID=2828742 RepID=UPI0021478908|nr:type I-E CRISPR-associated protein Cas6/Cse3/CasE [Endozoicomonas sp. SESOKO1]
MYLSRIQLTGAFAAEPELAGLLRKNSYGVHQLLWKLFDQGSRHLFREENSREQLGTRRSLPLYYVLSSQRPKQDSTLFTVESKPFSPQLQVGDKLAFRLRANPTVSRREEGRKNASRHDVVMDAKYQHLLNACLVEGVLQESDVFSADQHNRKTVKKRFEKKYLVEKLFARLSEKDPGGLAEAKHRFFREQEQSVAEAAENWLIKRGEHHGYAIDAVQATGYQWHALMKPGNHRNSGFSAMDYEGVLTVTNTTDFLNVLASGLGPSKGFGCGLLMIRRI